MAWEVWSDKGGYDSTYGHMGFFCNTADVSFYFVFLTDTYFDKGIFYDMWSKGGFGDPVVMIRTFGVKPIASFI